MEIAYYIIWNKMKKKKTLSEQFQDQIEKSLKGENSIPSNKQIHDWFGTCTSIKSYNYLVI
jgi:hypothetical protein